MQNIPNEWIGHALTGASTIIAVIIVMYQLKRQHKISVDLQLRNKREDIKLSIYEKLQEQISHCSNCYVETSAYARSIWQDLDSRASWSQEIGLSRSISELRAEEFARLQSVAATSLGNLIGALERWHIVFPASELFRWALSSADHDINDTFTPIFHDALKFLPAEIGDEKLHTPPLPSATAIEELKHKVDIYTDFCTTFLSYLHDLIVESQNLLLSEIFEGRIEPRKPKNSNFKVITLSDKNRLIEHFRSNTKLGEKWAAATKNSVESPTKPKCV